MTALLTAVRALHASRDRATALLSILAIALPHAVLLAVIGGVGMFRYRDANPISDMWINAPHLTLAYVAATLLVIPALSMGAAAARLAVSRKAHTLATLRLIGIRPEIARAAAAVDTLINAAAGVLFGSVLYVLSLPMWGFLSFQDAAIRPGDMWMGLPALTLCGLLMLLLTAVSSMGAMHKVAITPLGVVKKNQTQRINIFGVVATLSFIVLWLLVSPVVIGLGQGIGLLLFTGFLAVTIALMNVVGVFTVSIIGRIMARMGRTPSAIVAGRRLVSDPKAVWRSFGALGLVAFVVGVSLPVFQLIQANEFHSEQREMSRILLQDVSTGLLLTLGISTVLASISTAIQQAIRAIDSAPQRHALADMGAPAGFWLAARRKEVAYPALILIGGAVVLGLIFITPVMSMGSPLWGVGGVLLSTVAALVIIILSAESARLLERQPARV